MRFTKLPNGTARVELQTREFGRQPIDDRKVLGSAAAALILERGSLVLDESGQVRTDASDTGTALGKSVATITGAITALEALCDPDVSAPEVDGPTAVLIANSLYHVTGPRARRQIAEAEGRATSTRSVPHDGSLVFRAPSGLVIMPGNTLAREWGYLAFELGFGEQMLQPSSF